MRSVLPLPRFADVQLLAAAALFQGLLLWTLWSSGALTFTIAWSVCGLIERMPWTMDFGRWYAWRGWFAVGVVVALAVWGFRNVLGRQSAFPPGALDE